MKPKLRHPWRLSPARAIALQCDLAGRVDRRNRCDLRKVRLVLGMDVSYEKASDTCYGAAVLWDRRRGVEVARATAVRRARFPYVPGLLSFREAPVLLAAVARLPARPDLIVAEGHGLAHPRRFGLASHLGLLYDLPAIGCAKSRLVGEHAEPGPARGDHARLCHEGETVGAVLRTRAGVKPVFVSVGHLISLDRCRRAVMSLTGRYRMPELLRRAHMLANRARRTRLDA
jgi:deoxyribonuclease V